MTRVIVLYVTFAALVVALLYMGAVFAPSVLFLYPRTFGGELANKVFGTSILVILVFLSVLFIIVITKLDRKNIGDRIFENGNSQKITLCFIVLSPFLVSYFALRQFPSTPDEFSYLFQSQVFAGGALFAQQPPVAGIFTPSMLIEHGGKLFAVFPPGWPAVLAVGTTLGLPSWAVNPVLGVVSVILVYYLCSLQYERSVSLISCIIYSSSLFVLFNSASFFSHTSFIVAALCYAIFVVLFSQTGKNRYLVGAGLALSVALTIRYYPAVLMGIPLIFYLYKWRAVRRGMMCLALGGLPLAIVLAAYHAVVFGSPLKTGYSFLPDYAVSGLRFDIAAGLQASLMRVWELAGWASPTLVLLYLVAMVYRIRSRSFAFTDTLFPAVFLGFSLFWEPGGYRFGPRYLLDGFPFLVICTVAGVLDFVRTKPEAIRNGARHAMVVTVVYALCLLPFVGSFFHDVAWESLALNRLVEATGVNNAVVIVRSGVGRVFPVEYPELVRNDPYLAKDVLFARPVDEATLGMLFPSRAIWVYEKVQNDAMVGDLVRIR